MHKLFWVAFVLLLCQCKPYIHTSSSPPMQHAKRVGEVALLGGLNGEGFDASVEVSPINRGSVAIGYRKTRATYGFTSNGLRGDSASYIRTGQSLQLNAFYTPRGRISSDFFVDIPLSLGYQRGDMEQKIVYSNIGGALNGTYHTKTIGLGLLGAFKERFTLGGAAHLNWINYQNFQSDLIPDEALSLKSVVLTGYMDKRIRKKAKIYLALSITNYHFDTQQQVLLGGTPIATSMGVVYYPVVIGAKKRTE